MPKKYSLEFKERAARMVEDHMRSEDSSKTQAVHSVGAALGVSYETLRNWVRQARIDAGQAADVSTDAAEELRQLRRENAELRRANEILRTASAFFAAELDRPTTRCVALCNGFLLPF
ncbi:transposase [Nesterenkonia cremea]|uniref:Insertion element IS6110 uncharacterized 12.0 kDa protein n=1 Tax=Nesterenkonia cremea TaxID=1882340 RepID=A0A917ERB6_9MICC|nr:transposase [Nesterenkonia cremea]GGE79145.1 insertion element IS6110 uncharacterized 12.0 kDa protein [Nesterenkonia cremea]